MNPQNKLNINPGDKFGRWIIIQEIEPRIRFWHGRKTTKRMFRSLCSCGNIRDIELIALVRGQSKSCGCLNREKRNRIPVIPGTKVNRLTFIKEKPMKNKERRVLCKCDCGTIKEMRFLAIRSGKIKSCGCYAKEVTSLSNSKRRGENYQYVDTRLYNIWLGIKKRCYNKNSRAYKWYGGKGIKLCEEWHRFLNFRQWSLSNGYKETLSIERKNSNLDYSPSNCTWIPLSEQNDNKGNTRYIYHNRVKLSIKEASKLFSIKYNTLIGRLDRGWTTEEALSVKVIPSQKRKRNVNANA